MTINSFEIYRNTIDLNENLDGWSTVGGSAGSKLDSDDDSALATAGPDGGACIELRSLVDASSGFYRLTKTVKPAIAAQGSEAAATGSAMFCRGAFGVWVQLQQWPPQVNFNFFAWRDTFASNGYYQYSLDMDAVESTANGYEDGWQFIKFDGSSMSAQSGAPAWGDGQYIDTVYLGLSVNGAPASGTAHSVRFGKCYANLESKPVVLLSFDDGNVTDRTIAADYLQGLGLTATCYMPRVSVGLSGFLTETQVGQLKNDYGWSIGGHGSPDLTTLSSANQLIELQAEYDYHVSKGWGAVHYSYPLGGFDKTVIDNTRAAGWRTARKIDQAVASPNEDPDIYSLPAIGTATATLADVQGYLDKAIRVRSHLHLYTHGLYSPTATHTDPDVWKQMMELVADYKAQGRIDVMNMDQYNHRVNRLTIGDYGSLNERKVRAMKQALGYSASSNKTLNELEAEYFALTG